MYNETEKKERRKIIAIIIATVVLILALVAAIVITATSKSRRNVGEGENSSFVIADEYITGKKEEESENKSEEETKSSEEDSAKASDLGKISTESDEKAIDSAPAVSSVSSLPETGAEDLLPLALLLGATTTFATSLVMNKIKR